MQEEILSLKLRVSEQEEVLKGTIQRLRSTSRTKESMEHFIVNQRKLQSKKSRPKHFSCFMKQGYVNMWALNLPRPLCKSINQLNVHLYSLGMTFVSWRSYLKAPLYFNEQPLGRTR